MNPHLLIASLQQSGNAIVALLAGASDAMASFKPSPERWSMLEVLCHLVDEEREDFRQRVQLTLEDPAAQWPPIDPQRWVSERSYAARRLQPTLEEFKAERVRSLRWLHSLDGADWERRHQHPVLDGLCAGDLLASWAAHDLLHLRQIANLGVDYVSAAADPFSTDYAMP